MKQVSRWLVVVTQALLLIGTTLACSGTAVDHTVTDFMVDSQTPAIIFMVQVSGSPNVRTDADYVAEARVNGSLVTTEQFRFINPVKGGPPVSSFGIGIEGTLARAILDDMFARYQKAVTQREEFEEKQAWDLFRDCHIITYPLYRQVHRFYSEQQEGAARERPHYCVTGP